MMPTTPMISAGTISMRTAANRMPMALTTGDVVVSGIGLKTAAGWTMRSEISLRSRAITH